jgi:pre-mRNA-processing factor SLU7
MANMPPHPDLAPANKEENIYIPSFISKRPFYAGGDDATADDDATAAADYLQHQRLQKRDAADAQWYDRGKRAGPAATRFRKGACDNCGAMTHKPRDCLERPRAKGARWSGADIKADEIVQDVRLGWDAKRDRWNGYNPREYKAVIGDYERMEDLRRRARGGDADGADGADRYAEENDMSKHQSTATRQLRIREDTAKYLLNLDVDSAKYDPKTRALVDAGATADRAADLFAEEGFLRGSGDAQAMDAAQRYAWEAQERSGDTTQHLQANPTAGEVMRRKERDDAERKREERERALRDAYGGDAPPAGKPMVASTSAVVESEAFVEYDEHGLVKGAPKRVLKSRYAEDVFPNNHTTVWGSWWHNFTWGYACCRSTLKGSYCTGEAGRAAWEATERRRTGMDLVEAAEAADARGDGEDGGDKRREDVKGGSKEAEEKRSSKKRTREELAGGISEADLDEYRRKRAVANDPMAKMLGRDELVE